jgi:hypothetical protein
MNKLTHTVCLAVGFIALAACTSQWSRTDTSQFEIWKDTQKCREEAVRLYPDRSSGAEKSAAKSEETIKLSREKSIDQCMAKKHYTVRKGLAAS